MEKPRKRTHEFYDYHECVDYLEEKHGVDLRDFAGKFTDSGVNDDVLYQDFWHWLVDITSISNGAFFYMPVDVEDYAPGWVTKIVGWFHEEWPDLVDVPMVASW